MQPQQTTAQPQQPVVPIKEKNKSLPIILFLAILAIAGIGFGVYGMFCNNPTETKDLVVKMENEDGSTSTLETDKITISEDKKTITISDSNKGNDDDEVKVVLSDIYNKLSEKYRPIHTYDDNFPRIKTDDLKTATGINKSYGILIEGYNDVIDEADEIAIQSLTAQGFQDITDEVGSAFDDRSYENFAKQIICLVQDDGSPWALSCASTKWISEEQKEFINTLADAYYEKEGGYAEIFADKKSIKTKDNRQYLPASTIDGYLIFYKKTDEAKWHFAFGGQDSPLCSSIDEETKAGLTGFGLTCYENHSSSFPIEF